MENTITSISINVLAILIPALVGWGISLINKKIGTEKVKQVKEQIETKEGLAYHTVCYIEQAYKDLHDNDKLQKAIEWMTKVVNSHGLKLTTDELGDL